MAIGGYHFVALLNPGIGRNDVPRFQWKSWIVSMLGFPLIFLMVKFANIFNDGQENWKTAAMAMTAVEGINEGGYQLVLQLFIVFKRADRQPSNIQLMTLASSLMSCVVATIESIFAHKPETSIEVKASFIPYALLQNIYIRMASALIISTTQWNVIFILLGASIGFKIIEIVKTRHINTNLTPATEQFVINIILYCAFAISLIVIAVLVNYFEETTIWNLWAEEVKISELAVVKKGYFNYIFICCLLCGIFSNVLFYYQVMKLPIQEEEEANKERDSDA